MIKMANKQELKRSEARILVYLANARPELCKTRFISLKLDIAKNYTYDILNEMLYKAWVKRIKGPVGIYRLTSKGMLLLDTAKKFLASKQQKLKVRG